MKTVRSDLSQSDVCIENCGKKRFFPLFFSLLFFFFFFFCSLLSFVVVLFEAEHLRTRFRAELSRTLQPLFADIEIFFNFF